MSMTLEERILDSRLEFTLREVLGIAKKEYHDMTIELLKRNWLSIKPGNAKPVDELAMEEEYSDNHYTRVTTEMPVRIGELKDPVVALIDHRSEINLMSIDFCKKGKWLINTKHGRKIHVVTRPMKVGDIEID